MALKKLTVNGTAWIDEIYEHSVALSSKYAPISHTHTKSQITDLDSVENATYAQTLGTANAGYTYSTLSSLLAGKSDTGHTHLYAGSDSAGGSANKIKTEAGTTNIDRPVFFAYNGDTTRVVFDNDFKYNPATNILKIGTGTLSATEYSGNANTATNATSATTAASASKLDVGSVGSVKLPVYFADGVPIQIGSEDIGISISGNAATATKATQDGNGKVITDTYATTTALETGLAAKANVTHAHLYAGSSSEGGSATSAEKLNTNAGSSILPVYFSDGVPVAIDNSGVEISITGNAATANSALTAGTADKTQATLTVGNKNFNGSSAVTITAEDLGLSSAMKFIGVTTTTIEDGSTANTIIIDDVLVDAEKGNVVLNGHLEYIWTGSKWEILGDEQSYALKSIQVLAGDGLSGGGTLQSAITLAHADTSSQSSVTTGGRTYINSITLDDYGHVTALGTKTETDQTTISGNAGSATKLQIPKNINGTAFDGSADITTDTWGTARNVYISDNDGVNTSVATEVDGSGNVTLKLPTTINASVTGSAGSISGMTFKDNTAVSSLGWEDNTSGSTQLPTVNTIAYWNGAYTGTNSNLEYSKNGTIIGSSNIGTQSVAYATNAGSATYATYLGDSSGYYKKEDIIAINTSLSDKKEKAVYLGNVTEDDNGNLSDITLTSEQIAAFRNPEIDCYFLFGGIYMVYLVPLTVDEESNAVIYRTNININNFYFFQVFLGENSTMTCAIEAVAAIEESDINEICV
jgi:hypothetical protein